ncbi:hypothetical protein [Mycobacterium branderi]|uniref:Integral membrane protein n=1 Tax=Mycobacterium branderi TaxID=43348 RepID=A0A7I7W3T3_9MYCO|nr:hypothetical protein [Mycobacterium branderi]MCV7234727.1 hypothetical protein [Mycobacterium branderi]ORA31412.1 hypothetical protein BST20_27140 [Mycobacterium branderi]BBZ11647.1 hypothetical protein MBRA_18420 [Mycobacterium branderi]
MNETVATSDTRRESRLRLWVNWVLALLTIPAAAVVLVFTLGAVMSTAACSDKECPNLGPHGIGFGVLFYGAPVLSAVTIVVSFFTARQRWGFVVPLCALALLVADIVLVAVTVAQ